MAIELEDDTKHEKNPKPLDDIDIAILKAYVSFYFKP